MCCSHSKHSQLLVRSYYFIYNYTDYLLNCDKLIDFVAEDAYRVCVRGLNFLFCFDEKFRFRFMPLLLNFSFWAFWCGFLLRKPNEYFNDKNKIFCFIIIIISHLIEIETIRKQKVNIVQAYIDMDFGLTILWYQMRW